MTRTFSRLAPIATCSIALLILLSGCSRKFQKNKPLDQLPKTNSFISKDASIQGFYTVLDVKTCKAYLGANVLRKGYQPIYIALTNTSDQVLYFSEATISLPTVSANTVAQSVHTHTAARAIGFGIPGALGVACSIKFIIGATACPPLFPFVFLPAVTGIIVCSIPAVISTKNSIETNKKIDLQFYSASIQEQYIAPGGSINGLIFVRKQDFNPNFEISLTDSLNRPLTLVSNPTSTASVA